MKRRRVTKKQYHEFCRHVQRYANLFGLSDWSLWFYHYRPADATSNAFAWFSAIREGKMATFFCAPDIDPEDVFNPCEHALHEVLHLLLADLVHLGEKRWCEECEFANAEHANAEHAVVRRLTHAFLGKRHPSHIC